jgi:hypothetical protein
MSSYDSSFRSLSLRLTFIPIGLLLLALGNGCDTGGKEGDVCNPLVLRDECNDGLHCRQATCSTAYCCPTARASTDPNCNAQGCPDMDAGDDGGNGGLDATPSDGGDSG